MLGFFDLLTASYLLSLGAKVKKLGSERDTTFIEQSWAAQYIKDPLASRGSVKVRTS